MLSLPRTWVRSLVGELGSHKLWDEAPSLPHGGVGRQEKGVGDSRQRKIGGEDQVKIEAEAGVMWTSANKRLASLGVRKGRKEVPEGSRALPRSWSQTSGSLDSERANFYYSKPSTLCWYTTVTPGNEKKKCVYRVVVVNTDVWESRVESKSHLLALKSSVTLGELSDICEAHWKMRTRGPASRGCGDCSPWTCSEHQLWLWVGESSCCGPPLIS